MIVSNIFITVTQKELEEVINNFLNRKNILVEEIKINKSIVFKNIKYKKFKDITITLDILKIVNNKIYFKLTKVKLKHLNIPEKIKNIILKIIVSKFDKNNINILEQGVIVVDLENLLKNSNVKFVLKKILLKNQYMEIYSEKIFIKNNLNNEVKKNKEDMNLKLTQTTLRLSGDDIMSFVKDFVKTDSFSISGIDVSQAIYVKGIIINSFDLGDVSINIKDLNGNLLYVQIKIINPIFPGVNLEHIPIKINVKELLNSFNNLNLDLDISNVKFIDGCIEVKINNFNLDIKKLSSSNSNVFLK